MKSKIHSLLWTESRSRAGKKDEANHIKKKVKNFRFLKLPNLFWYPFWSSMDVISWPLMIWGQRQSNLQRSLAPCKMRNWTWSLWSQGTVDDTTRHDTSFFKVEDVGWPENVGRPYASGSMAEAGWTDEIQGFKLSAVMRIRRILYCVLISMDSSWYFFG